MNPVEFLRFFVNNSLFTFFIIFISFILGWVLYNYVILRTMALKESLFEKDNPAAWAEFIGAFIFPTLYLAARAVEGSASENIFLDLMICLGYAFMYILLLTALRVVSAHVIGVMSPTDANGRIDLNSEIYAQKNVSASLFSITLSVVFVSMLSFLDMEPGLVVPSLLRILNVLIFTILAFTAYSAMLRRKTSLLTEVFVHNNVAAGASFLGFATAVELILANAISLQKTFNYPILLAVCAISLIILGIFSAVFRILFSRIISVDIWNEIYNQNNVGAALGQAAVYISIAFVITGFMK